ncbi:MAG: LysM peptidoglycan-binding domain-containing protein [Verrucomicrobiae bacterium]|nr:LysM peptidoglycan-binding domain-containing protein [Verrucomicrobiae bacterium]
MSATVAFALTATGCFNRAPDPIAPIPAVTGPQPPAATAATPAPAAAANEPFSLKAGEQLVPHKVAKGDSLWELAQKYQTRVSRIKSANNLESDMIVEGRTLQIPTAMGGAPAMPATSLSPTPTPAPAVTAPQTQPSLIAPPAAPAPAAPAPPQTAPTTAPATPAPSLNFGTPPQAPSTGSLRLQN